MTNEQILHNAMISRSGLKTDFCIYNPLDYGFSDEELVYGFIRLPDTDFWNKIKSLTWSCSIRFFCVVNSDSIILGSVYSDDAVLCNKTGKLFEELNKYNSYGKRK